MADNLRITTPLTPNDGLGKVRSNREADPLATIDPSRIIKKDANTQNPNKNSLDSAFNSNSVFQTFAQRMQQTPALSQTLQKLISGALGQENIQGAAAKGNSVEELLSKLASEIKMDESQMLSNILFQQKYSTTFNSDLFKVLRNISGNAEENPEVKDFLGRFLKAYDGYFSSSETFTGIVNQLKNIIQYIPKVYRDEIESLINNMNQSTSQEVMEENLKILKENIIPLLGKYVIASNDLGETREKIALLVHDISRLNVSTKAEVAERFTELMDFCRFSLNIPQDKLSQLNKLFMKEMISTEKPQNAFMDALMNVLMNNSPDKLSRTGQAMLRETITNLLLDQSAFMPFNHIFLPIQYNGTFMFSEIWVEKDAEGKKRNKGENPDAKRLFLSFDIQGLGKFKAAIGLIGNNVECQINYPDNLKERGDDVLGNITKIFQNNGFKVSHISYMPETVQVEAEVFRKIYDGRSSIDVTV
ncbi:MAG: hypothetical protein RR069_01000 [Oscillospiraceae bacterium]